MKNQIKFRVHKAVFTADKNRELYYFLNVFNNYRTKAISITGIEHIKEYDGVLYPKSIENPDRQYPVRLEAGHQWETWINAKEVETDGSDESFNFALTYLKSHTIPSVRRKNVPPQGEVPRG